MQFFFQLYLILYCLKVVKDIRYFDSLENHFKPSHIHIVSPPFRKAGSVGILDLYSTLCIQHSAKGKSEFLG